MESKRGRKERVSEGRREGRKGGRGRRKKGRDVLSPGEAVEVAEQSAIHWSPYRVIMSFHCEECCCLGINIRSVEMSLMKMTFGGLCFCCICIKSFTQLDASKLKM